MKYFTAFTTLLLGAAASPVSKRQTAIGTVGDFAAGTIVNGNGASISFAFSIDEDVQTYCTYVDKSSDTKLPDVPLTQCDDGAVRWQFRQDPSPPGSEGQYRLVVIYTPPEPGTASESGYHEWSPDWFPVKTLSGKNETAYVGYTEFGIALS